VVNKAEERMSEEKFGMLIERKRRVILVMRLVLSLGGIRIEKRMAR
jgi:hypothetical protein